MSNMCPVRYAEIEYDTPAKRRREQLEEDELYMSIQKKELAKFIADLSQNIDTRVGDNLYTLREAMEDITDKSFWNFKPKLKEFGPQAQTVFEIFDRYDYDNEEDLIQQMYMRGELPQFKKLIDDAIKSAALIALKIDEDE